MEILKKPLITEKATSESELKNRFTFLVKVDANKVEIKKAVEKKYGVSVEKVWTQIYGPERRIRYTKNALLKLKDSAANNYLIKY